MEVGRNLFVVFLTVSILFLSYCEGEIIEQQLLLSPKDGEVFSNELPQFIWCEDTAADRYILFIVKDDFKLGETLHRDTVSDTTYSMPQETFDKAENGEYVWSVAPVLGSAQAGWWEFRVFTIDKSLPGSPVFLSPDDGAVFESESPTFIWKSDSLAQSYLLMVYGDDTPIPDTLVADTISDTTYLLSKDVFDEAFNGTYLWKVACLSSSQVFWSGVQSFSITKPLPDLDLDTTYFPMGLGYEWIFERYNDYYNSDGEDTWIDTVITRIIDSTTTEFGWRFDFENGGTKWIYSNLTTNFSGYVVQIAPESFEETVSDGDIHNTLSVSYEGHNLSLYRKRTEYFDFISHAYSSTWVLRDKGVGKVRDKYDDWDVTATGMYGFGYDKRLLYFIKDSDTVWRCEDCP